MNQRWRTLTAAFVSLVTASAISACGGEATDSGDGQGGEGLSGKKVTLITCTNANAVCSTWSSDVKEALESQGVEVTVSTHDFDANQEVQLLNQAISARPDLIILQETADPKAVGPALAKAKQQQVPIIGVDSRAEDDDVPSLVSQVIFDQVHLGELAAQNIVKGLEEVGKTEGSIIAITGTEGSIPVEDRMEGFNAEIAKHPGIEVIAVEDATWDPVKAGQLAQQLLAKFSGKVDAAYGMADYLAIPIIQAARQTGVPVGVKNKGLIVGGGNCTEAGIQSVIGGELIGTTSLNPTTLAEYTVDSAEKFLNGEELPEIVPVPVEPITADNASEFTDLCAI